MIKDKDIPTITDKINSIIIDTLIPRIIDEPEPNLDKNLLSTKTKESVIIGEYEKRSKENRQYRKEILWFTIIILAVQNIFLMWIIGYLLYKTFGLTINQIEIVALQEIVGLIKIFITGLIVEFIGIIIMITKEVFRNQDDIKGIDK